MYVMSTEDPEFVHMPFLAADIAHEVEELGGSWGAFVYNKEMAVAEYKDHESGVQYFEMDISDDVDIHDINTKVWRLARDFYECGHDFDCCGCWFFATLNITKMHTFPESRTHIVRASWSRNI